MGNRDLTSLPADVREAARVVDNGEVMWHRADAARAIAALAAAGCVILGLDVRRYADDGKFYEYPWGSCDPLGVDRVVDAERGRQSSMDALERLEMERDLLEYDWVLITWWSPEQYRPSAARS